MPGLRKGGALGDSQAPSSAYQIATSLSVASVASHFLPPEKNPDFLRAQATFAPAVSIRAPLLPPFAQ